MTDIILKANIPDLTRPHASLQVRCGDFISGCHARGKLYRKELIDCTFPSHNKTFNMERKGGKEGRKKENKKNTEIIGKMNE